MTSPMTPRPAGPALMYVTAGHQPAVCLIDTDSFNPAGMSQWDRAVCKALLGLALTKIEQYEDEESTGIRAMTGRLPEPEETR